MTPSWESMVTSLRCIGFDTNALIYLLEQREPWFPYVRKAMEVVESGYAQGVLSAVVEMEVLVRPLRAGDLAAYDRMDMFLLHHQNLRVAEVSRVIARQAADVRARTGLAALDSIIVATALNTRCDAIVGNDAVIASKITGIPYLYLNDFAMRS